MIEGEKGEENLEARGVVPYPTMNAWVHGMAAPSFICPGIGGILVYAWKTI